MKETTCVSLLFLFVFVCLNCCNALNIWARLNLKNSFAFKVELPPNKDVNDLKEAIYSKISPRVSDYKIKTIFIDESLDPYDIETTLAHELFHCLFYESGIELGYDFHRTFWLR